MQELSDRLRLHLAAKLSPWASRCARARFSWELYAPRPSRCWEHFAGRVGEASQGGRPESIAPGIARLLLIGFVNRGTDGIWRSDCEPLLLGSSLTTGNHQRLPEAEKPG